MQSALDQGKGPLKEQLRPPRWSKETRDAGVSGEAVQRLVASATTKGKDKMKLMIFYTPLYIINAVAQKLKIYALIEKAGKEESQKT